MTGINRRHSPLDYRIPTQEDGPRIWQMVKDSRILDLNSTYFYLTMSRWFSESCRVAVDVESGNLIGFVIAFRQPERPDTLFVWQIAVDAHYRGIARRLLDEVTEGPEIRFVETTIAPSNFSSRSLFLKWALSRESSAVLCSGSGFGEECFPGIEHEREDLYRIGPLEERRDPRRRCMDESRD